MKPSSGIAALILLAATIGSSVLAWKQYQELVGLRTGALNPEEVSDLQARVQELQQRNRELTRQLAATGDQARGELRAEGAQAAGERGGGPGGRGRGGPGSEAARAIMESPQAQALRAVQQKSALDARYAALFKNLNLPPAQLDKFKNFLLERDTTVMDVMAVAREQGIDPRSDPEMFRKLVTTAQADLDASIKSALGDAAFAEYQNYERTQPQRNLLSQLEQRLSYTDSPLTSAQTNQLLPILASTTSSPAPGSPAGPPPGRGGFGPGGPSSSPTATISDATIAQAQNVLTLGQVTALQQLQQQQQAQAQLQQLMNESRNPTSQNPGVSVNDRRR